MIKAILNDSENNRKILLLVLEKGNIDKLTSGFPMRLLSNDLNKEDFTNIHEIVIIYFETYEEGIAWMSQGVTTDTVIRDDRQRKLN